MRVGPWLAPLESDVVRGSNLGASGSRTLSGAWGVKHGASGFNIIGRLICEKLPVVENRCIAAEGRNIVLLKGR